MVCGQSTLHNLPGLLMRSPVNRCGVPFCFRPLWLSPRQVMVVPVGPTCEEYAEKVIRPSTSWYLRGEKNAGIDFTLVLLQVKQEFHKSGFMTDVDLDPGCTLNKKIRNAQLAQYNFILGQCQQLIVLFIISWLSVFLSI